MHTFTPEHLEHVAARILAGAGTPPDLAELVARALTEANLVGHDSHGIIRLRQYTAMVAAGQVQPAARAAVTHRHGATAVVDGRFGWGQPAAQLATRTAAELAADFGVSAVTIANCNHVGRLGEYVETLARHGFIGTAMCNTDAAVAPFGGRTRMLGTNPIAYAVPAGPGRDPILVDFATSGVAEGKLRVARAKGESVPAGLVIDKDGRPSTEPSAYYDGGALLPFGGHKGFGLSVMCELIGGVLSGMGPSCLPDFGHGNGTLLMALKVDTFVPAERFAAQVDGFSAAIKSAPRAPGANAILLPGEPESTMRAKRRAGGIDLPDATWDEINAVARELGVTLT